MPVLPNQTPGLLEACGMTRAEADRSAWAVDQAGNRWEGAAAINRAFEELGGVWAVCAWPYRLQPIAGLEEAAYRWVARNRSRLL